MNISLRREITLNILQWLEEEIKGITEELSYDSNGSNFGNLQVELTNSDETLKIGIIRGKKINYILSDETGVRRFEDINDIIAELIHKIDDIKKFEEGLNIRILIQKSK